MRAFLGLVVVLAILGALIPAAEGLSANATSKPASAPASRPTTVPTSAPAGMGSVVGKIVDANGQPVEGANVSVCILEGGVPSANTQVLGKTKSGKDGAFTIDGITPGEKRTLWVRRPSPGRGILTADVNDLKIEAGKTLDLGAVKVGVLRLVPQVRGGPEPFVP